MALFVWNTSRKQIIKKEAKNISGPILSLSKKKTHSLHHILSKSLEISKITRLFPIQPYNWLPQSKLLLYYIQKKKKPSQSKEACHFGVDSIDGSDISNRFNLLLWIEAFLHFGLVWSIIYSVYFAKMFQSRFLHVAWILFIPFLVASTSIRLHVSAFGIFIRIIFDKTYIDVESFQMCFFNRSKVHYQKF
jgi:hypothetical protein